MISIENHPVSSFLSDSEEIEKFAQELANSYVEYLDVNIIQDREKYQDAIEECLAHLEEVVSGVEELIQKERIIDDFVGTISERTGQLNKLFGQIDALEQYIFETNKELDQMDELLKEMERHQRAKTGKIKQIIDLIPGISSMPRLSLFSGISNLVADDSSSFVEAETSKANSEQITPIEELLVKLNQIDRSMSDILCNLNMRVYGENNTNFNISPTVMDESLSALNLNSIENVDGSWQELI